MGQLFQTIQRLVAADHTSSGSTRLNVLKNAASWNGKPSRAWKTASLCWNDRMLNPIPPSKSVRNFRTGLSSKRFGPCFVKVAWQSW